MKTAFVLSALFGATLAAQVSGPTSGYVFDEASRQLRPVRGTAGAAYLGSALIAEASAASASADGTFAITSRFGATELVRGFDGSAATRIVLSREPGNVLFAWSGHNVATVFADTKKASIWNADSEAIEATVSYDLGSIAGGILSALLDGDRLVITATDGVYLGRTGQVSRLLALADVSSVAVAGADLFVADRAHDQVVVLRDFAGQASAEMFAAVDAPVGLLVSRGTLLVASGSSQRIELFDMESKSRGTAVELDFLPTRLEALGSRSVALLNRRSAAEPLFVLDFSSALRVFFVPAGEEQ